jgi:hypothetical protein
MDVNVDLDSVSLAYPEDGGSPDHVTATVKFTISAAQAPPLELAYRVTSAAGLDAALDEAKKKLEEFALALAEGAKKVALSDQASPKSSAG